MNMSTLFIKDLDVFNRAKTRVEKFFLPQASLPNQVFQRDFSYFEFEEFDWSLSAEFWLCIQKLAIRSRDSTLLMAVLDPEPAGYFYKQFGYYSWADVPASISQDDYWNLLNVSPAGSPADSVLTNSEKIIWLPDSAEWAIWGERSSGVCVLATRGSARGNSWHSLDWALRACLPNSFANRVVPHDFETSLRVHYSSLA